MISKTLALSIMVLTISGLSCPDDKLCLECEEDQCLYCYGGYLQFGECQPPTNQISHCHTYEDSKTCSFCEYGYYLTEGICKKIPFTNCATVTDQEELNCYSCFNKIQPDKSNCDKGKKCFDNCDICDTMGCHLCSVGYVLDDDFECIETDIMNCLQLDADGTACLTCLPGYYHHNGRCLFANISIPDYVVERERHKLKEKNQVPLIEWFFEERREVCKRNKLFK